MIERLKRTMQRYWRGRRMQVFQQRMMPVDGCRILDLGGTADIWLSVPGSFDITLVNLEPSVLPLGDASHHRFTQLLADATQPLPFAENSFDLVFSNSVIEHVGSSKEQQAFANAVQRLAPNYWIQTPSPWFPLEAHSNLPFWWFWPDVWKRQMLQRWKSGRKVFLHEQMLTTTELGRQRMNALFPDSSLYTERFAGWEKSNSAYRNRARDLRL